MSRTRIGKVFILGIGSKARQGKDTIAEMIKKLRSNVYVVHFADALYEEVKNADRTQPLIKRTVFGGRNFYYLKSGMHSDGMPIWTTLRDDHAPFLNEIMTSRGLMQYDGMDEKDPLMLQFWGTQFRRKSDENYWVKRAAEKIHDIILHDDSSIYEDIWILIPDTRFKNEYAFIKQAPYPEAVSKFIKVVRLNEDGSQFIDPSRNNNHESEIGLDGVEPDYLISAKSGDLDSLQSSVSKLLKEIENEETNVEVGASKIAARES